MDGPGLYGGKVLCPWSPLEYFLLLSMQKYSQYSFSPVQPPPLLLGFYDLDVNLWRGLIGSHSCFRQKVVSSIILKAIVICIYILHYGKSILSVHFLNNKR